MKLPEDLRRPSGGDTIDNAARDAVRLAHHALDRFPELVRRHKFIAGGAAISSALVALAGVAIAKRMRQGESADEALASVTEADLEGLRVVEVPGEAESGEETEELAPPEQAATNGREAARSDDTDAGAVQPDDEDTTEASHPA